MSNRFFVRCLCVVAAATGPTAVTGRLRPIAVRTTGTYRNESAVLDACRTTVRDVQPFVLVVFALASRMPDDFLVRLHDTVGTAVLLTDGRRQPPPLMDSQTALMMADDPGTLTTLVNRGPDTMWDPLSHYVWLVPTAAANISNAKTLFRAAWRRRWVVNAVLFTGVAYTYNPFRGSIRQHRIDADELRAVARLKMNDLNGYPVRICMFPTRIMAVKQPDGTYKGTDGMIVSTLAKRMNFTPVYKLPSDGKKYGWYKYGNASTNKSGYTYTGLLGDLVHNKVDMAFNGAFLQWYESNNSIRYTAPVLFDELCFVVPKAHQMSQWRAVFTAFDIRLWYFLAATFVVALSAWTLIKRTTDSPYSLTILAVNLFQIFLMVPLTRVPRNVPERLMVLSTVLFGFIVATSLQAVMVKYLSYPKYEKNVATMQELYNTGMPVLSASVNLLILFEKDDHPLYLKMAKRFVNVANKSFDILGEVASKRVSAAIGRKEDLVEKIARSYVKNNEVLLHIVEECPRTFHIIYLIRRDVPFMNVINRIITGFVESGIVNSWFMHAKPFRPISDYHHQKDTHKVFAMKNVVIAFLCLGIGLTVSGIFFLAELVYFHKLADSKMATPPQPPPLPSKTRYPRKRTFGKRF